MTVPNSLPESKVEYYQRLVDHVRKDIGLNLRLMDLVTSAAFTFYHCEVPLEHAKVYVKTLVLKRTTNERRS